jgi:acetoin utilization deacetylase AcuC-like enzyme
VAARVALESYSDIVQNVLVVDLDVHQGNGTAAIFENDENVFTFSLHAVGKGNQLHPHAFHRTHKKSHHHTQNKQDKNYPWKSRMQSDLDVAVGDISDAEYNAAVQSALEKIEQMLRDAGRSPDLVFFQAGVDPLEQDRLGRLNITREV